MAFAQQGGVFLPQQSQTLDQNATIDGNLSVGGDLTVTGTINSSGDAFADPVITGTVTGGATYNSIVLATPTLGVATATSINKVAITAPASSATLTIANTKTLTVSNTLTLAGTDATVMTFPTTTATIARTDAANVFTGTQTVGALVATTVNGNTITTGTGVLTIAAAKTLTASNSITLAGTDSTTMTFPAASASILSGVGLYKVARVSQALDGSNPTSWATGLTTIIAATTDLVGSAAPGLGTSVLTSLINGTSLDVYAWKPTGQNDTTLVASTGTETFYAIAIGT